MDDDILPDMGRMAARLALEEKTGPSRVLMPEATELRRSTLLSRHASSTTSIPRLGSPTRSHASRTTQQIRSPISCPELVSRAARRRRLIGRERRTRVVCGTGWMNVKNGLKTKLSHLHKPMPRDRRRSVRVEWNWPATIYDVDQHLERPCILIDLSSGGAKIAGVRVERSLTSSDCARLSETVGHAASSGARRMPWGSNSPTKLVAKIVQTTRPRRIWIFHLQQSRRQP